MSDDVEVIVHGQPFSVECPVCSAWFWQVIFCDTRPSYWHIVTGENEAEVRSNTETDPLLRILRQPESDREWDA